MLPPLQIARLSSSSMTRLIRWIPHTEDDRRTALQISFSTGTCAKTGRQAESITLSTVPGATRMASVRCSSFPQTRQHDKVLSFRAAGRRHCGTSTSKESALQYFHEHQRWINAASTASF